MGLHGSRLTSRAVVSVASAAAIAALLGAGSASAVTTGTVAFTTQGTSVSAAIDATTDMAGETIDCKFDVVNQSATSTTKTAFKSAESAAGIFSQTLKIENLQPGKYDAKVHCHETTEGDHDEEECLDKTAVLTVGAATTPGGNTTPPPSSDDEEEETPPGFDGMLAMVQEILSSLFAS